jgi:hypothetical protein
MPRSTSLVILAMQRMHYAPAKSAARSFGDQTALP